MPHKILVVDDELHIRETLEKGLTMMGYTCRSAKDGEEALQYLASEFFDIVIADIRMPRMDGMALLRTMRQEHRDVDVIMMTGFGQEHTYMEVIEAGATDFIAKPFRQEELQAKVKRVSRERALRAELLYLSLHDSLTGLFNRRFLYQRLQEEVERAKRQKRDLAMIIMDVDHFKEYNDLRGHLEGDQLLAGLSQILSSCIRQNVDTVYRYGGDEFAILLIEADISQARSIAERIRRAFEAKHIDRCTLSLGVAQLQPNGNHEDLIRKADEAMYRAKRAGGNRVEEFVLSRDTP